MTTWTWVIVTIIAATYLFEELLQYLNNKARMQALPASLVGLYDEAELAKQRAYQHEHYKVRLYEELFFFIVLLIAIFAGLFGYVDHLVGAHIHSTIFAALAFFGILYIAKEILTLPFSYYQTFVIEQKYGFNKSTRTTFITDIVKGLILMAIIGGGLLMLATLLYQKTGTLFWLYCWIMVSAVSIFFIMFNTSLIVPLFNKLSPLPEGELRDKILAFATQNGFAIKNIFVMDGSKRSAKANAYFSGFGHTKTVVLFDTLIDMATPDEIVAVLGHEIGHYKLGHITRQVLLSLLQTGIIFYALSLFLKNSFFPEALGMNPSFHAGLLVFALLLSPVMIFVNLFAMYISRTHELEADKYAKERTYGELLASALKKLSRKNYSNPTPHPLFVKFKYSHPPVADRLTKLQTLSG